MGNGWNLRKITTSTCGSVAEIELNYKLQAQLSTLHLRYKFRGDTADFESEYLVPNPIEKEGNIQNVF